MTRLKTLASLLLVALLLAGCMGGSGDDKADKEIDAELAKHPENAEYTPLTDSKTLKSMSDAYKKLIEDKHASASERPRAFMTVIGEDPIDKEQGPKIASRFGFTYRPEMRVTTLITPKGWIVVPSHRQIKLEVNDVVDFEFPSANDIADLKSSDEVRSKLTSLLDSGAVGILTKRLDCKADKAGQSGYSVSCNGTVAPYIQNASSYPAGTLDWINQMSKQQSQDDGSDDWKDNGGSSGGGGVCKPPKCPL
ncbi:hypothetical protein [Parachitinimonas caeni]|uniref:Lipoprotein n=1 Tax=Parachitinimonas caeni TaxID=3031301 RepID=A0ABT7E2T7_9NEIS|nr:hypothetical protein [Parachitinimonas caeni]MDK2126631.1 hypothetical protein [Parachitinimonas caeni]